MSTVTFAEIEDIAVEVLNTSLPSATYGDVGTGSGRDRYKAAEITPVFRLCDLSIARQILNNPKDGRRSAYLTTTTVAHGAAIPPHVAPIDAIFMTITGGQYAGTRGIEAWGIDRLNELEDENRNPQTNPFIRPHAVLEGLTIFHNAAGIIAGGASGASLSVRYATLTYASGGTVILSPDECARAIACAGLAIHFLKDGQRASAAQIFEAMYRNEMRALNIAAPDLAAMAQTQEAA